MSRLILLLIMFSFPISCFSQKDSTQIDTVNVYEVRCGLDFKIYKGMWFSRSYYFSTGELNHQDSIVLLSDHPKYLRVYDSRNQLWLEGTADKRGRLSSNITYYYKSGKIEHTEFRNERMHIESCPDSVFLTFEHPMRTGTWQYYRRDGTLKREKKYTIQADDCSWNTMDVFCQTTKYKRNGKVGQQSNKKLKFRKVYGK